MCQRNLRLPATLLVGGGVVLLCALMALLLWGSGRIKNRVERWQVTNDDARNAAQTLIATNPAVRNPVGFSGSNQTTVEHWDRRWRVSGYIDTRPQPGVTVRTLYFAVLLHNGSTWNLEDLQLQSTESGSAAGAHKN
jgi:hypothetical protein